jgi:TetR/AcrR family transcriptional regulator, cholesterol catabolism regulator
MPKGIPLTEDQHSNRRREIASTAANLFVEHGFPETSMREIAAAAGMGKSSLYDYFKTKDEILLFIIEDMGITLTERARLIAGLNIPPDAQLKQIMEMQLSYLQASNNLFWLLSSEAQRLKPESQRQIQERRYVFQDLVGSIIEQGIASGRFRVVHPLNAARLLTNSLFSILYTTRPTGSAEAMLDEVVEIFLRGIRR